MAIGFPAYAVKSVRYRDVSRKQLHRSAEDALDELGWRPYRDGKWCLRGAVPNELHGIFLTWGAKFIVEIEDEEVFLRSEGAFALAWLDLGQHDRNIHRFLDTFEMILEEED